MARPTTATGPCAASTGQAVRRPGRARGSRRHLCACARDRSERAPRLRQGLCALVPGTGAAARQRASRRRHGAARSPAGGVPRAGPAGLRSLALEGQPPAGRRLGARARLARVRVASQFRCAAARVDRGGKPQPLRGGARTSGSRWARMSSFMQEWSGPPRERCPAGAPALHARSRRGRRAAQRVQDYVGVTAYVRGRTPDGNGAVSPFVSDSEDAAAVIDWIARQPWSDGRVAMLGDGYSGYAAWAAARRKPAALKAIATIAPMAPGIDFPMAGQIYRNAMVRWAQEHATREPPRADADVDPNGVGRHSTRPGIARIIPTGTWTASCWATAASSSEPG